MPVELTSNQHKILSFIEQSFYETGSQPTDEKIQDALGMSQLVYRKAVRTDEFRGALVRKGLQPNENAEILTTEQMLLINILLNTWDKRSPREKIKDSGITYSQYRMWMRQPAFQRHLQIRADQIFADLEPLAKEKFVEAVEAGNFQAVERVLEAKGALPSRSNGDLDVGSLLGIVLEILVKYVAADVLEKVADELEFAAPGLLGSRQARAIETKAVPVPIMTEEVELGNIFSF